MTKNIAMRRDVANEKNHPGGSGSLNRAGRPTRVPSWADDAEAQPSNPGLDRSEPLLFEIGAPEKTGVDFDPCPEPGDEFLGGLGREEDQLGLYGLSEPETLRHYVRLSQQNHAIDLSTYPLGSCTMKHNPRQNEKIARLPGLSDIHPLQPVQTVQGALAVMQELARWLCTLTHMPAVALAPKAGAHGEFCGMLAIKKAIEARGQSETNRRKKILVPKNAHGTNPATAIQCGFNVVEIEANANGHVDLENFDAQLDETIAGLMLTNPNTCGLFEPDIRKIADALHEAGGYFYCDGANFNALAGMVRPGDLGIDAMHINLHKTFSTPHGGGGPGAGPTVLSEALAPYAPLPFVKMEASGELTLVEDETALGAEKSMGRLAAFHGQMGMFTRALAHMMAHGADGLMQMSKDAVLNANYILHHLKPYIRPAFPGYCMHEALFDDKKLKENGVELIDFAKAMIDAGFHPMTTYFPLVVSGAMLIEPTETESRHDLDRFIAAMQSLLEEVSSGKTEKFKAAPVRTAMGRLDETRAARQPILVWQETETT